MNRFCSDQRGIVHVVPIIVASVVLVGGLYLAQKNLNLHLLNFIKVTPTPIVFVPTPTASPSATPTPSVKPTATPKPTLAATPTPVAQANPNISGTGYQTFTLSTEKGNFKVSVLSLDLNSVDVVTDTANDSDCATGCNTSNLADFVKKNNGFAGVNGSYFCPDTYPDCTSKTNSTDFPVYNSRLKKWINQGNLFWNDRAIFYVDGSGAHHIQSAKSFSGGLNAGVVNYPGVLSDGNVQIADGQDGMSDKQKEKGTKVGIGVKDNKNIMVVVAQNANMQDFGYIFKSLGARGALNLDTGGSTALYYNGSYMYGPGRNIPNAIIFVHK